MCDCRVDQQAWLTEVAQVCGLWAPDPDDSVMWGLQAGGGTAAAAGSGSSGGGD